MTKQTPLTRVLALISGQMSDAEFARAVGESAQVFNNWKRRGTIPAAKLPKIAAALGVAVDDLLTGGEAEGEVHIDTTRITDPAMRAAVERLISAIARGEVSYERMESALKLLLN